MRNRTESQIIEAYNRIARRIKLAGLGLKKHILDNEASANLKETIQVHVMSYELVPPGNHRRNISEQAIQTENNNFVAVLCGIHDDSPMHLWCRLLPQAECQMNMLRQSNVFLNVSAYARIHGQHDYMRHPWAPVECPVQVHEPSYKRKTSGWHIGTSLENYRCFRKYISKTSAERVSDTVFFKHKYLIQPTITPEYAVMTAAKKLNNTILVTSPQEHAQYKA